jgi:hypothetical protein
MNHEEDGRGVVSIAMPVRDDNDEVIAAVELVASQGSVGELHDAAVQWTVQPISRLLRSPRVVPAPAHSRAGVGLDDERDRPPPRSETVR